MKANSKLKTGPNTNRIKGPEAPGVERVTVVNLVPEISKC